MIKGQFEIEIDGKTDIYPNMVVNSGKKLLLRLLGGEDVPITSLGVGSSNTAESSEQTNLVAAITTKNVSGFVWSIDSIVFETLFTYNEGNGTIRELAVFGKDGAMFARRVVPDRTKDNTQVMKIRYKVGLVDV
jgi:hypothetical protein